ncbi:hypothetical protein [Lachnotalea glycerini]|uniref:Uncharacterized protein n=1 Tax=Lachnotalea glycerini TaxID=1763509 RepID=A0A371JGN9_9FIRM|nr:hypothetical protein [Lachnotalea glycerini]RDY31895.1 hypothetical protein CG710_007045 [Lachnotalea glycerini]
MNHKNLVKLNQDSESENINQNKKYKEVKINKMIVNGKEQEGNIILAEDTKGKTELNVTVYTQDIKTVQEKKKGNFSIYELLKKCIFHNRRS